jgi:glycosyltransferase involved in cell wall biosynthesis
MCTHNSEKFLPIVLPQIEKVIPRDSINKRFIIDDFSIDKTKEVAESLGWPVYHNHKQGLVNAQRLAVSLVETDFYASFEHDLFLTKDWFPKIPSLVLSGKYEVAQGIRVRDVSGFREADFYDYNHRRFTIPSEDNTFYKKDRSWALEKYFVDNSVCSGHLRGSVLACLRHDYFINLMFCRPYLFRLLRCLVNSPYLSLKIFSQTKNKSVLLYYPLERLFILFGALMRSFDAFVAHKTFAVNGEMEDKKN